MITFQLLIVYNMIYDYISTFNRFRLILESIFLPLYYKAFYKHKGETLLTCCSTYWEGSWWDITPHLRETSYNLSQAATYR